MNARLPPSSAMPGSTTGRAAGASPVVGAGSICGMEGACVGAVTVGALMSTERMLVGDTGLALVAETPFSGMTML